MINDVNYEGIKFPVSTKDIAKIERQNHMCINVFCYENNLTYILFMYQIKNLKIVWICCSYQVKINHAACISKILTDSCAIKQKIKKTFFLQMLF